MTNIEVVECLLKTKKPYDEIMEQTKFHLYCRRIKLGKCKPKTVKEFFLIFGFVGDWNDYEKIE
jgi:hypothetical protein